jgi:riboflavin synthase
MFSGIIEEKGRVEEVLSKSYGLSLRIYNENLFQAQSLGNSIAVNGVCLTQSAWQPGYSTFDVIFETLDKTSFGSLKKGDFVNLERSLKADSRIEGHFVQGHVDGVGILKRIDKKNNEYWIEIPEFLSCFLIMKGAIALDGVSLTIAEIEGNLIRVALIPYTLEATNLKEKKEGDQINIEVDLFAKYTFNYLEKTKLQMVTK